MPAKRRRGGGARRIRGGRPVRHARRVVRRSVPKAVPMRGASNRRARVRTVKRQKARARAKVISPRPRPVVRPRRVPRRVMAKPRHARKPKRIIRPARAPKPSARRLKKRAATAVAVATAAGLASQFLRLNTASAHPDIAYEVGSIQTSLDDLQDRAGLSEVQADIANLDANLRHALSLLESARDKGYKYQNDLEDIAFDTMSRWQEIRNRVEDSIHEQAGLMRTNLLPVDTSVQRLNATLADVSATTAVLGDVQNEIRQAMDTVYDAERTIEGAYSDIESKASQLTTRLTRIHWALTQRDEASFAFDSDEDLYMAVTARWDQEGKEDPEGILFLPNQRLIFERKEKVSTKKILFITTSSELIQEPMVVKPLAEVKNVKAQGKGLFGHQDFLEVEFSDKTIPFHLSGQDSEDWARMVRDAKSGKIEGERATGSGLSFADLTGEITEADIVEVQNEVNELQDEMMLKDTQDELAELENEVNSLSRELADLRARGYVIEKSLEVDVEVLTVQWEKMKQRAYAAIGYQIKILGEQMSSIQGSVAALAGMTGSPEVARPLYMGLKSEIASAEAHSEAAEATVLDQYDEYADEIETLDSHMEWVDWMLDALSTASFQLMATESGVAAVEAEWQRPGTHPENGILFLSDQRLLWEDRVGDFEVKLEVPISQVENAKEVVDEESGEESLMLTLGSSAPLPKARFSLDQPVAEEWLQMIGRARSGGYASDRAVEIDPAELERIRSAPEQCPNCGAAFTSPILRGQTEIVCEFCGVATRI